MHTVVYNALYRQPEDERPGVGGFREAPDELPQLPEANTIL